MKSANIVFIFFVLSLLVLLGSIYFYLSSPALLSPEENIKQQKIIEIEINDDGTSNEHIIWRVSIESRLLKFSQSEWGLYIPKESTEVEVKSNGNYLDSNLEPTDNSAYKVLMFQNPGRISLGSDSQFDISYKVNQNPLVFSNSHYYKRTFTRFETDDVFLIEMSLPIDAEISLISLPPKNQYNRDGKKILEFSLSKGQTEEIVINFKLESEIETVFSEKFEASIPKEYAENLEVILRSADKLVEKLEEIESVQSPYVWRIEFINLQDVDFEADREAFYLREGRIRMKTTILQKSETEILTTILHEVVHGFNAELFPDSVPNFWWNEGTAQYLSLKVLEENGYDVSGKISEQETLIASCQNADKSFISSWSPSTSGAGAVISCDNLETNELDLGYALSYEIVGTLDEKDQNVFSSVFSEAKEQGVAFSSNHKILNDQMNYLLSEVLDTETTTILNSLDLRVDPVSDSSEYKKTMLTGFNVFEKGSGVNLFAAAIVVALVIILIVLMSQD